MQLFLPSLTPAFFSLPPPPPPIPLSLADTRDADNADSVVRQMVFVSATVTDKVHALADTYMRDGYRHLLPLRYVCVCGWVGVSALGGSRRWGNGGGRGGGGVTMWFGSRLCAVYSCRRTQRSPNSACSVAQVCGARLP